MSDITRNYERIDAQFEICGDDFTVSFSDPSYVRAEAVVYDQADHALYAVMYDGLFYVADVPERFHDRLMGARGVKLMSYLPCGHMVDMMARLCVDALEKIVANPRSVMPHLTSVFAEANEMVYAP